MLNRSSDVELDFDFDNVVEKSKENPLYYVQYAYARISSVFRHLNKDLNSELDIDSYENSFVLNGQTIWQILHEMTLRHPGYIYGSRPYGNSLEYRVFFGVPNQRYWSKRITNNEIRKLNKIFDILKDLKEGDKLSIDDITLTFPSALAQFKEVDNNEDSIRSFFTKKAYEYYINKTKDRFVPFRQFHFVSSKRNLIGNNINT